MYNNNEQLKQEARNTILKIFAKILQDLREDPAPSGSSFYEYQLYNIEHYRDALLHEVDMREATCKHPLNAAFALETLHNGALKDFDKNLSNFKYHSQHSGLYPTTRRIATVVTQGILFIGAIALASQVHIAFVALAIFAFFSAVHKIPRVFENAEYQDIHQAKERSKDVYNFYKMLRKPPPSSGDQDPPPPQYQPLPSAPKI